MLKQTKKDYKFQNNIKNTKYKIPKMVQLKIMTPKKSQSAIEFMIVLSIALIFMIVIISVVVNRTNEFSQTKNEKAVSLYIGRIDNEISFAKRLDSGYSKIFTLPDEIDSLNYSVSLLKGKELSITSSAGYEYLEFLPQYVYGEIGIGNNKIMKEGNYIGFCNEKYSDYCNVSHDDDNSSNRLCYCYNKFPINLTGIISCSKVPSVWEECNLVYGDKYIGIRTECPFYATNVSLTIKNIDDDLVMFQNTSSRLAFGLANVIEFDSNLNLSESGDYSFNYTCSNQASGLFSDHFVNYYVPYGYYEITSNGVSLSNSNCTMYSSTNYTCPVNQTFMLTYDVECMDGECGNTDIYLDPINLNSINPNSIDSSEVIEK